MAACLHEGYILFPAWGEQTDNNGQDVSDTDPMSSAHLTFSWQFNYLMTTWQNCWDWKSLSIFAHILFPLLQLYSECAWGFLDSKWGENNEIDCCKWPQFSLVCILHIICTLSPGRHQPPVVRRETTTFSGKFSNIRTVHFFLNQVFSSLLWKKLCLSQRHWKNHNLGFTLIIWYSYSEAMSRKWLRKDNFVQPFPCLGTMGMGLKSSETSTETWCIIPRPSRILHGRLNFILKLKILQCHTKSVDLKEQSCIGHIHY